MESPKQSTTGRDAANPETDVNLLLYKTARSLKNFFVGAGRGIAALARGFMILLLFIVKNVLWLLLGAVVGIAYSIYQIKRDGATYSSEMIVRANFGSAPALYGTLDYLNALIASNNTETLAKALGTTPEEASRLKEFSIKPIKSDLIIADMYREKFIPDQQSYLSRHDTIPMDVMPYSEFRDALTIHDYPLQAIRVKSTDAASFPKIEQGIVRQLEETDLFREIVSKKNLSNREEEMRLTAAIEGLDTLRRAYNERLSRGSDISPAGTSLSLTGKAPETKIPELELYDRQLSLQNELGKSRTRAAAERHVIEVYSPLNPAGVRDAVAERIFENAVYGLVIVLIVLLIIGLYRTLIWYERMFIPAKKQ